MARAPYGGRSREEYERLLLAKLDPAAIRSVLGFAGLYQMTHEMLKHAIVEKVRGFYVNGFDESGLTYDERRYQVDVFDAARSEGRRSDKFSASAAWLIRSGAITEQQGELLRQIYGHRHALAHELAAFIVDVDRNPDPKLFNDALEILRDIHRFWTQVEIDIGTFEHLGVVTVDDAAPSSLVVLQLCIDAYLESAPVNDAKSGRNEDQESV